MKLLLAFLSSNAIDLLFVCYSQISRHELEKQIGEQGSVATYLGCGGVVNNQIKKVFLFIAESVSDKI